MVKELHQNARTLVAGEFFVKITVRFFSLIKLRNFFTVFSTTRISTWQLCFPSEFDLN